MKQSMHEFFHYVGQDIHFRNANMMMGIIILAAMIAGMLLLWFIHTLATKPSRHAKFSGSLDDLVDSVNGISCWKPKSQTKK